MTVHQGGGKPGRWACGVKQQPGDGKPGEWVDCPECQRVFSWDSTSERVAAIDAANAAHVVADATIARLTLERDEARAVAADKREDLGFSWVPELVEWLGTGNGCECWRSRPRAPDSWNHDLECDAAAWARRIGGIEETQRQVDAAHEAALVEDRQRTEMRGAAERMGLPRTVRRECPRCRGSGVLPPTIGSFVRACDTCHRSGYILEMTAERAGLDEDLAIANGYEPTDIS